MKLAAIGEINSFMWKFKQLLLNGYQATFNVEANNGEAFIVMKAGVGASCLQPAGSSHVGQVHQRRRRSPAYFRRQPKRMLKKHEIKVNENTGTGLDNAILNSDSSAVEVDMIEDSETPVEAAEEVGGNEVPSNTENCSNDFKEKISTCILLAIGLRRSARMLMLLNTLRVV